MRAIIRRQFGGPEVLEIADIDAVTAQADQVLIDIRAFGLNHAELYMRRGEWGDVAPVSGIECVGSVALDPSGRLAIGQTVLAAMGGMGRTVQGSYAERVAVRAANVVPVHTRLPWERLAMLPESYGTAWSCLHQCLQIQAGQRLLVRGGTSALGRAAIDLGRFHGAHVDATTRREDQAASLRALGAEHVWIAGAALSPDQAGQYDAVLDLLGNRSLRDSLRLAVPGGRVCLAGFLAGREPITDFNPLTDMPSTVQCSFFGSFNFGSASHPMRAIPYQAMADAMADGLLRGKAARVFAMEDIPQAHALMESGEAGGKLVVLAAQD